ncbi:hypothetical protein MMC14_006213 [Varicellaria rhodocarpa]|nr:hypothetical protein [Varicellaria rhodocarpa]
MQLVTFLIISTLVVGVFAAPTPALNACSTRPVQQKRNPYAEDHCVAKREPEPYTESKCHVLPRDPALNAICAAKEKRNPALNAGCVKSSKDKRDPALNAGCIK